MESEAWQKLHRLGAEVVAEQSGAWDSFWLELEPELESLLAKPTFLGRLSGDEDCRRDVLMVAWEKLQDRDYSKLRAFYSSGSTAGFRPWMQRVVKNIGIDYMRALPEHIRLRKPRRGGVTSSGQAASSQKHWHSIIGLSAVGEPGARDAVTIEGTARKMLEFLETSLPERQRLALRLHEAGESASDIAAALDLKSAAEANRVVARAQDRALQRPAVELWSQGFSDSEIAEALELDGAKHAHRIVSAAKEHLRRYFRE